MKPLIACMRCAVALAAIAAPMVNPCAADTPVTSEDQVDALMPRRVSLEALRARIQAEPDNLDSYYAYAKAAEAEGKLPDAAWAYREMLKKDASLDRVRLDLSLAYVKLGLYVDASEHLKQVLAHDPPPQVRENIETVLAKIGTLGKRNAFSGTLTTGVNYDTNANAAPSSGNITVLDTTIPLGQGARRQADLQGFAAATFAHAYQPTRLSDTLSMRWKSTALAYSTEQQDLDSLDVSLLGLRTGPEFYYGPMGMKLELAAGYNYLLLDKHAYLRNPRGEILFELPLDGQLAFLGGHIREYREFLNSPTVTVYDDRTGNAWQNQLGLRYLVSAESIWEGLFIQRREDARQLYYASSQSGFSLTHTHLFEEGYFTQARLGVRLSDYDEPDLLISSSTRSDEERSAQLILGRRFEPLELTLTGSYTYTGVSSNIQNYNYKSHRIGIAVSKGF